MEHGIRTISPSQLGELLVRAQRRRAHQTVRAILKELHRRGQEMKDVA